MKKKTLMILRDRADWLWTNSIAVLLRGVKRGTINADDLALFDERARELCDLIFDATLAPLQDRIEADGCDPDPADVRDMMRLNDCCCDLNLLGDLTAVAQAAFAGKFGHHEGALQTSDIGRMEGLAHGVRDALDAVARARGMTDADLMAPS